MGHCNRAIPVHTRGGLWKREAAWCLRLGHSLSSLGQRSCLDGFEASIHVVEQVYIQSGGMSD